MTLNNDRTLTFWDPHTFHKKFDIKELPGWSFPLFDFSPDGGLLCTWGLDAHSACLWETAGGRLRGRLEGCFSEFAKDGKSLVTCLPGGVIKVWDGATGQETATLHGARDSGIYALVSPDGRHVLTTAGPTIPRLKADGSLETNSSTPGGRPRPEPLDIRLWDARTCVEQARFSGARAADDLAEFSPDGRTVVYARPEPREKERLELVLWDVAAGREWAVLRTAEGVRSGTFSPDGRFLFTVNASGAGLKVWEPVTGKRLPDLPEADQMVNVEVSPDGTMLAGTWKKYGETELLVFRLSDGPAPLPVQRGKPVHRQASPVVVRKAAPNRLPPVPPPTEAAKALAVLTGERETAKREFSERLPEARSKSEQKSLWQRYDEAEAALAARALQIARDFPTDPAATKALQFVLRPGRVAPETAFGRVRDEALAQIRRDYLSSRHLAELQFLFTGLDPDTENGLLADFVQSSRDAPDRGEAALRLANALAMRAASVRQMQAATDGFNRRDAGGAAGRRGPPRQPDPDALERDAARWYTLVLEKYGDVASPGQGPAATLRDPAERGLFAVQHLGVGKVAPEIAGDDLEGKPFKLSDYRGKVVVLVFKGNQPGLLPPTNAQNRRLVERLAGKPFALLEVHSDNDPEAVKREMRKEGLTWRCWFDKGRPGPISLRWTVHVWPAVYVLDASGVIRHKGLHGRELDAAVDGLLRELTGGPVEQTEREGGKHGSS